MAASTNIRAGFDRDNLRQLLNVVLATAQIAVIAAGNNSSFDQRAISDPPIVPAQYAFLVWAYIYPASVVYAAYQALPGHRRDELLRRIGFWTASAYASMTMWAICAQQGWYWLTVVGIFWMLISLLGALVQIVAYDRPLTRAERWLVVLPISIHAGWVTAAAIANTATTLDWAGFPRAGLSDPLWASIMAVIGTAIGSGVTLWSRGNPGYALTVVWALVGIAVANRELNPGLAVVATGGAVAVASALLWAQRSVNKRQ